MPPGVQYREIAPVAPARLKDRMLVLLRALRVVLASHAQVVHIHDPDFLPLAVVARFRGKCAIYDVHEYYGVHMRTLLRRRWLGRAVGSLWDLVELALARLVGNASVVAPSMAPRLERAGVTVAVTPNHASARDFSRAVGPGSIVPSRQQAVVSIGTLDETRGALLLPAIARALNAAHPEARFLVIRRFLSSAQERALADEMQPGASPIDWLKPLPSNELADLLRTVTVGLSILLPGGQNEQVVSTKLFEYMSQGLAIVASDLPGQRSTLEPIGCAVFVPANAPPAEYAEVIASLLRDPERASAMGQRGQDALFRSLTWEQNGAVALIDLYERLGKVNSS